MIISHENDIYMQFLGGASEVGATSVFIYWQGTKILIDSGKRTTFKDKYPIFDEIDKNVDVFILTHLHQDHVGSFLECDSLLNLKKILTSEENKEIMLAVLKDSQKHVSEDGALSEVYSDEKIEKIINRTETLKYYETFKINNLKITFYKTSHLLGSLGILFESKDYCLFFTSDFTESQKFFHPKTEFITKLLGKKIDTLVTETTYGSNNNGDEVVKESCLKDLSYAINTVFKSNGNIIIPCFALGRMQEVIVAIIKLILSGEINMDTKIYVNGKRDKGVYTTLGMKLTEKYFSENFNIFKDELNLGKKNYLDNIKVENKEDIFKKIMRKGFLNIRNYSDVLSTFEKEKNSIFLIQPGMLGNRYETKEKNRSNGKLALEIASGKKNGIIFVGYQANNTVGGAIQSAGYGDRIDVYDENMTYVKTNKNIFKVTFPGHASIKGIKKLIKTLEPKSVVLVHGDIEASKNVAESIKDKNVLIPEIDEKLYLVDNGKKVFFSMQHKFSKIIVDLENKYKMLGEERILSTKKYADYPIVKLFKNKVGNIIQPELISFEFIINNKNKLFFEKIQEELIERGINSNIRVVEEDTTDKEIMNLTADLISDTNEKAELYILSTPLHTLQNFILLGEMSGAETYLYEYENFEMIPQLPYGINREIEISEKEEYDHMIMREDFQDLMYKLLYYRSIKRKKVENRYSQRPDYDVRNPLYQRNIFFSKDRSLWGDIDNIFGIKNKDVVRDLEKIYSKLNQKISSIQMLNYVYSYDKTKEYREILGCLENQIYGKYNLENGVQYFLIELRENISVEEAVKEIGKYKEL